MEIQRKLSNIGSYGCYLLCLLHQAKVQDYMILSYYDAFRENGWTDDECTILKPLEIMKSLTGKRYRVMKSNTYRECDFAVAYFYNPTTKLHHFALKDGDTFWDPLGNSLTVKEGYIESWRLYKEIN